MSISLSIVIVNWNTGNMLRECCQSIANSDMTGVLLYEVIVVDNASSDGSADGLVDFGLPLNLIVNEGNLGFGVACNQGAALATGELMLFVNPDVRLYPQTLAHTLGFMSTSTFADVGICGVYLEDSCGNYTTSYAGFPTALTIIGGALGFQSLKTIELPSGGVSFDVDQVIGAYFLIRSTLFRGLGGFDERFFVYFEEVDLSLRARKAGWRSVCLTEVRAFHFGGGSSRQVKAERLFYFLRSRLLYASKHFSKAGFACVLFVTFFVEVLSRTALAAVRRSRVQAAETWAAYGMLLRWVFQCLLKVVTR